VVSKLLADERGSAYAWLLFFVAAWVFSTIFFFYLSPLWSFALQTAELNGYNELPGAAPLYTFWASLYPLAPLLVLAFLAIGLLKYASSVRRDLP